MGESQKIVMVVEDDLILNLLYQNFLQKLGFTSKENLVNAETAIEMAEKINPDLIIMDIALRGELDGIEAMQEIRKFSACPVIYITANSSSDQKRRAHKSGFHDFLVKPIDYYDLKKSVDNLFEKWFHLNQNIFMKYLKNWASPRGILQTDMAANRFGNSGKRVK